MAVHEIPWEQNACFTIKAGSQEECEDIATKLDKYARKIGAGALFCDYSEPQPEDTRHIPQAHRLSSD